MNVIVLAIEPNPRQDSAWDVKLTVGNEEFVYPFIREDIRIADKLGWGLNSDPRFRKAFKWNNHIMVKVTLMTMQIAKGETVELPMMIGRFYTPEEARAYMEQYWQEKEQHLTKEELEPVTIDRA
jgi:hypothetical protein